jgi:hypothetical protein
MQTEPNTESRSHRKKADKPLKILSRACVPLSVTEPDPLIILIAGNIHLADHTTDMQLFLKERKLEPMQQYLHVSNQHGSLKLFQTSGAGLDLTPQDRGGQ